ncbi:hypothetical protein [Cupriavidus sp. D39]|uniref:hypothetical protein n=1 Tax=Cupriavidus sp. D39 TaxID=2997877 RepID=UPI00226FA0E3|nr:hypothetical protein [Cupriavidus sp. D39]MCY0856655.1 hypothetical protein [Cupriavidus sp. D39]
MAIWSVLPPSVQPEISLVDWRVFEFPEGDRHFVGYCLENREGRVSSAITVFDCQAASAETASGRRYRLIGEPGQDADAEETWRLWLLFNWRTGAVDVTADFVCSSNGCSQDVH